MRRIQVYLVNDRIYFTPTISIGKIYSEMTLPIIEVSFTADNQEIGECFLQTFHNSSIGENPSGSSDAFKQLLKMTKLRLNKRLISKALCLNATLEAGIYTLMRVGGNKKYKAFMDDIGINPVQFEEANITREEIGLAIKELFRKTISAK